MTDWKTRRDDAADEYGIVDAEKWSNLPNIFQDVHFKAGADFGYAEARKEVEELVRKLVDASKKVEGILNDDIGMISCEASVYTLDEDQFGMIMYCRDLLSIALKEFEK